MWKTSIGRLRVVALMEGASYLVLLGIAMPLKYLAGYPAAVSMVGQVHGLLFLLYLVVLFQAAIEREWRMSRVGVAVVAAMLPIGAFIFDARLREDERALRLEGAE